MGCTWEGNKALMPCAEPDEGGWEEPNPQSLLREPGKWLKPQSTYRCRSHPGRGRAPGSSLGMVAKGGMSLENEKAFRDMSASACCLSSSVEESESQTMSSSLSWDLLLTPLVCMVWSPVLSSHPSNIYQVPAVSQTPRWEYKTCKTSPDLRVSTL